MVFVPAIEAASTSINNGTVADYESDQALSLITLMFSLSMYMELGTNLTLTMKTRGRNSQYIFNQSENTYLQWILYATLISLISRLRLTSCSTAIFITIGLFDF